MNNGDVENIDPEIERLLTIGKMSFPEECDLEPALTEKQLEKVDRMPKDSGMREVFLAISTLERKIDYSIEWQIKGNRHQRYLEAKLIEYSSTKWKWMRWAGVTLIAGLIATIGKKLADKISP